jgi:hypothetical protein
VIISSDCVLFWFNYFLLQLKQQCKEAEAKIAVLQQQLPEVTAQNATMAVAQRQGRTADGGTNLCKVTLCGIYL